ncbi:hypothetical protein D0X99_15120 [Algoriphagus lacus]|uniref:Carboxypeptidase regulatory-like domain-containing protein n=1 Tax=Algoriphagus lacus TaxID=2056311 RepID=A0A418PPX4_9BACT|nr:hypothetical protein [Algoriphagus lacus]RIW14130.1 hypothetical protein D0X99_15120 [Algoriphagus lacus]
MNQNYNFLKKALQLFCLLLIQSCGPEDPTIFSGEVVDTATDREIPGVTLLVSVYEKAPFLTLPGIIREDTLDTDSQGKFRLLVPFSEQYSRFTISVLKEVATDTYEFVNGKDCSPYDCSSFRAGNIYKFKLKIPLDSL